MSPLLFFSVVVTGQLWYRYGKLLDLEEQTFNAGVYGINLGLWRKRDVHSEVLYWLDKVSIDSHTIYSLGSLVNHLY